MPVVVFEALSLICWSLCLTAGELLDEVKLLLQDLLHLALRLLLLHQSQTHVLYHTLLGLKVWKSTKTHQMVQVYVPNTTLTPHSEKFTRSQLCKHTKLGLKQFQSNSCDR